MKHKITYILLILFIGLGILFFTSGCQDVDGDGIADNLVIGDEVVPIAPPKDNGQGGSSNTGNQQVRPDATAVPNVPQNVRVIDKGSSIYTTPNGNGERYFYEVRIGWDKDVNYPNHMMYRIYASENGAQFNIIYYTYSGTDIVFSFNDDKPLRQFNLKVYVEGILNNKVSSKSNTVSVHIPF